MQVLKRNVVNPYVSRKGKEPQGKLMDMRAKEDGISESRSVIERIGITSEQQHYPTRKRADFHQVLRHKRTWQTDK